MHTMELCRDNAILEQQWYRNGAATGIAIVQCEENKEQSKSMSHITAVNLTTERNQREILPGRIINTLRSVLIYRYYRLMYSYLFEIRSHHRERC